MEPIQISSTAGRGGIERFAESRLGLATTESFTSPLDRLNWAGVMVGAGYRMQTEVIELRTVWRLLRHTRAE